MTSVQDAGFPGHSAGPSARAPVSLKVETSEEAPNGGRRPLRLALTVETAQQGPISPSVASMMKGRDGVPLTPKSPANRRMSLRIGTGAGQEQQQQGENGEWKLDSPKSPLFLRRRSANNGQAKSPSFTMSIPANDCPSPCCPSPLVQEERTGACKPAAHHDDAERSLDQREAPATFHRKKSFIQTGMVPGPY